MTKTYSAKPSEVTRKWYVLDASKINLGRLSTRISQLLMGKGKPMYTAHIDCGDYVVVINSDKLKLSGNKLTKKKYYSHSGYPGNLKEKTLSEMLQKDSTLVITGAVKGMLPDNKLRRDRLARLKVYEGEEHPHSPQSPEILNLKEKV